MQLMGIAYREAERLKDEGCLMDEDTPQQQGTPSGKNAQPPRSVQHKAVKSSPNQIAAASHLRFTRELSSYTRAVCMRLGYA